jgi:hypothetical protein
MLGETLEESANTHDHGTDHDRPSPSEALVEPRGNRNGEDGAELVAG